MLPQNQRIHANLIEHQKTIRARDTNTAMKYNQENIQQEYWNLQQNHWIITSELFLTNIKHDSEFNFAKMKELYLMQFIFAERKQTSPSYIKVFQLPKNRYCSFSNTILDSCKVL